MKESVFERDYGFITARIEKKDTRALRMRLISDDRLGVTASLDADIRAIDAFVLAHRRWIEQRLAERRDNATNVCRYRFQDNDFLQVFGAAVPIVYRTGNRASLRRDGDRIVVTLSGNADDDAKRAAVDALYDGFIVKLTREAVAERLPVHERATGLSAAVSVRTMHTRWGSCTPETKRIRVNAELAKLPPVCLDYVLIHELAHLVHPRHDAAFYAFVDRYFDRRKEVERYLRSRILFKN